MPTPEEISNLCRLCLEKRQVSVLIFEEQTRTRSTFVKISSCLPVKVSKSDALPKKICEVCSGKLDSFYEFWKQSSESEKQLQDWLKQPPPEPAPDPMPVLKQEEVDFKGIGYSNSESAPSTSILSSILQTQVSDEPPLKKTKFVTEPDTILHTYDSDEEIEAKVEQIEDNSNDSNSNGEAEGLDYGDDGQVNPDNPDDQPGPSGVGKSSDETPFEGSYPAIKQAETQCEEYYCQLPIKQRFCYFCDLSFNTFADEKRHNHVFSRLHQHKIYACELCPQRSNCKQLLRLHAKSQHGKEFEQTYTCDMCDTAFVNKKKMNDHLSEHSGNYKYNCKICNRGWPHIRDYRKHLEREHEIGYTCERCQKVFKTEAYYKKHLEIHSPDFDESLIFCPICHKKYATERGVKKHMIEVHQEYQYVCEVCGKRLKSLGYLKVHMRIHKGEKPYKCNHCEKSFNTKNNLNLHQAVHTGERKHVCKVCQKAYTQRSTLTIHMRSHSGEKPYECSVCLKKFVTRTIMKYHNCKGPKQSA